ADRLAVHRLRPAVRRLPLDRAARPRSDAPAGALPDSILRRRPDFCVRALGIAVRDVPVPDPLPAERPRLLAVSSRAALPARHRARIRLQRRGRRADRPCSGPRVLLSVGLALSGAGLLLMSRLTAQSACPPLLSRFLLAGAGLGDTESGHRRGGA